VVGAGDREEVDRSADRGLGEGAELHATHLITDA
jgi:hypothetical protein